MASTQEVTVPFIKRKGRSRPTTTRQRTVSPGPGDETSSVTTTSAPSRSEVVLPARKSANRLISAGTKRTVSKREEDDAEEEERDGPGVKWTAEGSHINAAKEILRGDEAEELLAKRRKAENADGDDEEVPDDGMYRGQKGYTNHIKKRQEVPKAMRVGPQRNTSTIRTVTIVDYQPDVCKDYKGAFPPCGRVIETTALT
jgi:RING finger protein 113A